MATHVALLRGINVGGRNKVAMADLRRLLAEQGHRDVATYIQSGNIVLTPQRRSTPATLARNLHDAIADGLGVSPVVIVRTAAELDEIVAANPYPQEADRKHLHAIIQQEPIGRAQAEAMTRVLRECQDAGTPDHLTVIGSTCYLHTPGGLGRSKLAERLARAKAVGQDRATARNWATMLRLQEMLRA